MIFFVTQWTPYNKTEEWFKTFQEVSGKFPSYVKKWQTFACPDEDRGIKGYNIIMVEKGNADEKASAYERAVWLFSIKDFEGDIYQLYEQNVKIAGVEPVHPDFSSYMSSGWVDHKSPFDFDAGTVDSRQV